MAVTLLQASVPNSAVKVADLPPGVDSVTLTVAAPNTTFVYFSTTNAGATTTQGAPVPGGSTVTLAGFPGSKGVSIYAIGSVAGPTPVGVFISTAQ